MSYNATMVHSMRRSPLRYPPVCYHAGVKAAAAATTAIDTCHP